MSDSPKLYLAMDTCFAIKRWIRPSQWMPLIKELGFNSIEASTDNEMDPLFAPVTYMEDWVDEVQEYEKKLSMKVRSFFTGYQTYRTAGLAHHDARVRAKIRDEWYKPLICSAERLHADIGFSFHAIQEEYLQDPEKYRKAIDMANNEFALLAAYARKHGGVRLCCEQMYAPYQPPFTIESAKEMLKDIYSRGNSPFYIAVDVGHMVGQVKYRDPSKTDIINGLKQLRATGELRNLWLGPLTAYKKMEDQAARPASGDEAFADELIGYLKDYAYMFSHDKADSDPFAWLEDLGPYSPIVHMQQTDGIKSSHAPFTPETNKTGIITGERLLRSLAKGYEKAEEAGMPPRTDRITLAFEIFVSNVKYPYDALEELKQTAASWRKYIPEDGISLDEAIRLLK